MAEPFLGEIRMMSFNFPPKGWALCNGQLLPINQNQGLFSLLGTMYGGNGQVNFGLPNLQARVPMHMGAGHTQGEGAGTPAVTLTQPQMPSHTHQLFAANVTATTSNPTAALMLSTSALSPLYAPAANLRAMAANAILPTGGSQPHENRQPYTVISFCIALQGIFPSQN
jgi:microcystin-dependent protein